MNTYDYPYDELSTNQPVHLCPECRDLMAKVVRTVSAIPAPEPEPDWSGALRWLDTICGDRGSVMALDDAPLVNERPTVPASVTVEQRQRLDSTLTLLDGVARQFFEPEAGIALRRALSLTFERRPGVVMGARTPSLLAHGVVWAVGHANGLLRPLGTLTEKELRDYLTLAQSGSTVGAKVRDALVGPYRWEAVGQPWSYGRRSRDLEPLGHVELLVSGTRRQLVEVRDRALAAQAAEHPDDVFYRAG